MNGIKYANLQPMPSLDQMDGLSAALAKNKQRDEMQDKDLKGTPRWCTDGTYWWSAKSTMPTVNPGIYKCALIDGMGPTIISINVSTDDLLEIDSSISKTIIEEFRHFWTLKETFDKYGFIQKRGYLLHGPAGCGKTSTINLMIGHIITNYEGIAIYVEHPHVAATCLQMVRRHEPTRPIICVIEDIEALIRHFGEKEFLSLLDGESQVDNVVFVATTNYLEDLDDRIKNRPSRFDRRILVSFPSADMRATYFKTKVPDVTDKELSEWVDATSNDMSFAHMREFIVSVRVFGYSVDETIKRLNSMFDLTTSEDNRPRKPFVGFGSRGL